MQLSHLSALTVMVLASVPTAQAQSSVCKEIVSKVVKVSARNDEWTSADVKVQPGDLIIVSAKGEVHTGPSPREVCDADGLVGNDFSQQFPGRKLTNIGRLQMKVGTGTVFFVGKSWLGGVPDPGHLKLRVNDAKYDDNSGSFDVYVLVIPKGVLPQPTRASAEE